MGIAEILTLVSQLVPIAKEIATAIHGAATTPDPTSEVLDLVSDLTPKLAALMETLDTIKNQTEAQAPQVWAAVRDDYKDASAKFDAIRALSS